MLRFACFYKGRATFVTAPSALAAQTEAAAVFKARKRWDVTVRLVAREDGTDVIHVADF